MFAAVGIVLLAGFVHSVTGFGFALIATPLLLFVFEPKSVVVINIILPGPLGVLILFYARRHVDIRQAALICLGSLFGIPLGVYLLSSINPSMVKLVVGVLVIPFSVLLLLGHSHRFKKEGLGCGGVGLIGGGLGASTSLFGPPVVLYLLNQSLAKEQFVATVSVYTVFAAIISAGAVVLMGMVTTPILMDVIILSPALIVSFYIGIKVRPKINVAIFKRIAALLVSITALILIVNFLLELA